MHESENKACYVFSNRILKTTFDLVLCDVPEQII